MEKVLGIVIAAVVAVALTGRSGFDDEPATQIAATASRMDNVGSGNAFARGVIYGVYEVGDQTRFTGEGEAARKVVEQHEDKFIYVDAKVNPEEYLKAIDDIVANQAKGIATCIPDQTMSQVVVDKRKEAGIPMVTCDDTLQNNAGDKLTPWVGIDAYVIDQANEDWLAVCVKDNSLMEDEQCGLLFLTMDTVSSCVLRAEGEYDNSIASCPDFPAERIFRADCDGITDKGNVAATSVTTAHSEIKKWPVTGTNKEGIIGVVRILGSVGLDGDARVVGLGAYMVKDGWNGRGVEGTCMKAATYFSSDSVSKGSVEVLYKVIGGKELPLETAVDVIATTPESYREVMGKTAE